GDPAKAPSRSTTCSRAPSSARQRSATAMGSSENTVWASARPSRSRTQRPSRRSTAGITITVGGSPRVLHEGGEVLQHAEAPALALLGMELRGVDVARLQRRRESDPVLTPRPPDGAA